MSVVGYLGGNVQVAVVKEFVESEQELKGRRRDGEELPGGLRRAGDVGEFYDDVEDYDPVLRWHCRL